MATKRAAGLPQLSASSSEETSASDYSSSDESGDEEVQTRRTSSPPKQKPTDKSSTTPLARTPRPTKPTVEPSQNRPPDAAASRDEGDDEDEDDTDQEEDSGEDGSISEESDTENARTNKHAPPPLPPVRSPMKPQPRSPLPKPTPPKPASDSGSSEGSDAGSDSSEDDAIPAPAPRPSHAADLSIKFINTKPMDDPILSGKPTCSPASTSEQDSLSKKGDSVDNSQKFNNEGRQWFQRLWSLDDEITLLNGVVEYRLKNGSFPSRAGGMDVFRDCIKGSLQMEVTSAQLVNKLKRLKKKFQTNVTRQKNGKGPTFTKRQEQDAFELSMKLWGTDKFTTEDAGASPANEDNELSESETKVNRKRKEGYLKPDDDLSYAINKKIKGTEADKSHYPFLWETVTKIADENRCGVGIKRALEMLDDAKANLMGEKLKKLRTAQIKQHLRRADLYKETLKLIFDGIMRPC